MGSRLQNSYQEGMIRCKDLSTLEELKRANGRLKTNMAPGTDGVTNEILEEVIAGYPEILLETFNSIFPERRFFEECK